METSQINSNDFLEFGIIIVSVLIGYTIIKLLSLC